MSDGGIYITDYYPSITTKGKTMSDHNHCSETETQNAQNIIALAELLYKKGILNKTEIDRIFTTELEPEFRDFVGRFPLDLLPESAGFVGESPENIDATEQKIYDFMNKNSIPGQIIAAISSIQFCRYEISVEPETDVRTFSRLQDELCQLLKVKNIRIFYSEDNHVCLEVPHTSKRLASIRQILESEEWEDSEAKIPLAIGENVSGEPVILDLDQIRNLLVVGSAKSSRGACLNSVILSLLHKFSPDELQLFMYAPEQAFSCICRSLPHLSRPLMTTPEEVRETFDKLIREVKRRRWIIAAAGADDLNEFNTLASAHEKMPRIVLIIDDFADLKLFCQMDDNFIRIAKKGGDVGIHLIFATENADVKVVSGVIKHLFPTRICFQTATQIDSRIVLDAPGAEKLSASGDILMITPGNECLEKINAALTANCDMRKAVEFISESVPLSMILTPATAKKRYGSVCRMGMLFLLHC